MNTITLDSRTVVDIEAQVAKILRGLGNPEPPLDLRLVREILSLDRAYYSSTDHSAIRESASRILVAGKQVLKRPGLLAEAIRKLNLRALYLPDQRRILLDTDQPILKHRWNEAHEIGHSIIPWHQGLMGDNDLTLIPSCHEVVEAEANFAAGRLLFLGERFVAEARDCEPSLATVRDLATRYGNTATSTLWRFVENVWADKPMFALISGHPHVTRREQTFDPDRPCRYFVRSAAFEKQFANVTEIELFREVGRYCGAQKGGLLGSGEVGLSNGLGEPHLFGCETFYNRYDALTLGVHISRLSNR